MDKFKGQESVLDLIIYIVVFLQETFWSGPDVLHWNCRYILSSGKFKTHDQFPF